jgi:Protein of unknown function (DUF3224)
MGTEIKASFEITKWDEHQFDRRAGAAKMTRAKVGKSYSGDIDATSITEWLMAYADDGTATFVGLERIDGIIAGRRGTLALQHVGEYKDGAARADLKVIGGACSGQLAATTGTGDFLADPAGHVLLDLFFR